jgi:hypothetical protein
MKTASQQVLLIALYVHGLLEIYKLHKHVILYLKNNSFIKKSISANYCKQLLCQN